MGPMNSAIPSLREAQKALTRSRIVDAARAVFGREGYGGTSIGLIANAAAINRATFYLHFSGKVDVFRAVFAHDRLRTDEYWRELNTALLTGTRHAVEAWLERITQWYLDNAPLMPAMHEAMAADQEFSREFQPHIDRLTEEVSEYLERFPGERRTDERIRIQMLIVMTDQMFFHSLVQGVWSGPQDQLIRVIADTMCRSLGLEG
jgi:AcrR family transcriptional regulator